jgi:hypothetical protein
MSGLDRFFKGRRRRRSQGEPAPLEVCDACGEAFVQPIRWSESGPEAWWLLLRCGACGMWRELFARNEDVEAYDRFLDRGTEAIARDAHRLDRERLFAEADTFAEALKRDLITADDFV